MTDIKNFHISELDRNHKKYDVFSVYIRKNKTIFLSESKCASFICTSNKHTHTHTLLCDNLTFPAVKITCLNLHGKRYEKLYPLFHYYCSLYSHGYKSDFCSLKNNTQLSDDLWNIWYSRMKSGTFFNTFSTFKMKLFYLFSRETHCSCRNTAEIASLT